MVGALGTLASKLHRYTPETVVKPALLEAELVRVLSPVLVEAALQE